MKPDPHATTGGQCIVRGTAELDEHSADNLSADSRLNLANYTCRPHWYCTRRIHDPSDRCCTKSNQLVICSTNLAPASCQSSVPRRHLPRDLRTLYLLVFVSSFSHERRRHPNLAGGPSPTPCLPLAPGCTIANPLLNAHHTYTHLPTVLS